jgi:methylitaconate Delta-isomerase
VLMRSGTSKAVYLHSSDLPPEGQARDNILRRLMGSPDPRQIDGLGGGDLLTSKVAIVGPPSRPDADVDYTFAQIDVESDRVDWSGNCGNLSVGVGPFAVDEGLVAAEEPVTLVRIHNTNTGKVIRARVPVRAGAAQVEGDCRIDGVPGSGAPIEVDLADTAGAVSGSVLPLGDATVPLDSPAGRLGVTLIDAGNPTAFVRASDLGVPATMTWAQMADAETLRLIERTRCAVALAAGLSRTEAEFHEQKPLLPQLAVVGAPAGYFSESHGGRIDAATIDLTARLFVFGTLHRSYPLTGVIATAVAARLPGSVVWDCIPEGRRTAGEVVIGHPCGTTGARVRVEQQGPDLLVREVAVVRTARRLMEGWALLPFASHQAEADLVSVGAGGDY